MDACHRDDIYIIGIIIRCAYLAMHCKGGQVNKHEHLYKTVSIVCFFVVPENHSGSRCRIRAYYCDNY